ncbi:jg27554 [Pararge aegeria aegeria]|uniref:Jg27554 protein n=1 Tax=Pararge aegeria aegeria TaxID=348720 RepID=A0A8S4SDZ2_9NEOP|nr:jg27554 [Pararge aegeria aegeria]
MARSEKFISTHYLPNTGYNEKGLMAVEHHAGSVRIGGLQTPFRTCRHAGVLKATVLLPKTKDIEILIEGLAKTWKTENLSDFQIKERDRRLGQLNIGQTGVLKATVLLPKTKDIEILIEGLAKTWKTENLSDFQIKERDRRLGQLNIGQTGTKRNRVPAFSKDGYELAVIVNPYF